MKWGQARSWLIRGKRRGRTWAFYEKNFLTVFEIMIPGLKSILCPDFPTRRDLWKNQRGGKTRKVYTLDKMTTKWNPKKSHPYSSSFSFRILVLLRSIITRFPEISSGFSSWNEMGSSPLLTHSWKAARSDLKKHWGQTYTGCCPKPLLRQSLTKTALKKAWRSKTVWK